MQDLAVMADKFEGKDPKEVLKWALESFDRIAIASSFSTEDVALIEMASQIHPGVKVIFLNTGFHFPETLELVDKIAKKYPIELERVEGEVSLAKMEELHGKKLYERDLDLCCKLRKVEPLKRALKGLEAWITGMRREQSPTRANMRVVEKDGEGRVKINPLASWTTEEVWCYIRDLKIPFNSLYDKGYTSIGCEPCTRLVKPGEDDRAGRWAGSGKQECGIHTFGEKD